MSSQIPMSSFQPGNATPSTATPSTNSSLFPPSPAHLRGSPDNPGLSSSLPGSRSNNVGDLHSSLGPGSSNQARSRSVSPGTSSNTLTEAHVETSTNQNKRWTVTRLTVSFIGFIKLFAVAMTFLVLGVVNMASNTFADGEVKPLTADPTFLILMMQLSDKVYVAFNALMNISKNAMRGFSKRPVFLFGLIVAAIFAIIAPIVYATMDRAKSRTNIIANSLNFCAVMVGMVAEMVSSLDADDADKKKARDIEMQDAQDSIERWKAEYQNLLNDKKRTQATNNELRKKDIEILELKGQLAASKEMNDMLNEENNKLQKEVNFRAKKRNVLRKYEEDK